MCCIGLQISISCQKKCLSLIGLHAFTGNDYASSFFRKEKNGFWKLIQKCNRFEECFALLGTNPALAEETIDILEEYVGCLYGVESRSVKDAR